MYAEIYLVCPREKKTPQVLAWPHNSLIHHLFSQYIPFSLLPRFRDIMHTTEVYIGGNYSDLCVGK
jgi:hypothetical protein